MEQPATIVLRIVAPHRAYGEYIAGAGVVRLRVVQYPTEAEPADLGVILDTRAGDGGELEALLLGEVAHPPDCLVEARPLGLLTIEDDGQTTSYIVAVAAADPGFADVTDVATLAPPWCDRLQAFFQDGAQVRWNDREAAWALIRQARQAARLARAEARRPSTGPAWRPDLTTAPVQNGAAPETVRQSRAEYAFSTLPLRFQMYVADYLTPLERVRFFVPRPRMLSAVLRRTRLAEGILILTTEQLLFLEEVLPPDVTEMSHGYLVRGVPIERIADVALEQHGGPLLLGWRAGRVHPQAGPPLRR
jgi:inorganic pyrophosphatase